MTGRNRGCPEYHRWFFKLDQRFLLQVIPMKKISILILSVILALAITGYASAEVTVGTGATTSSSPQAGNSFTTGSIYVVSTPPGSSAVLDGGEDQLFTPGTFSSVPPGVHNVMITMPGYQPSTSVVKVTTGTAPTLMVIVLDVAGFPIGQAILELRMQTIWSPATGL